jgi:hypothetical protein
MQTHDGFSRRPAFGARSLIDTREPVAIFFSASFSKGSRDRQHFPSALAAVTTAVFLRKMFLLLR